MHLGIPIMGSSMARLSASYWSLRLQKSIAHNDVQAAQNALAHGASLSGWRAKGPYMDMGSSAPPMRFTLKSALEFALHWQCPAPMFEWLLQVGAPLEDRSYALEDLTRHAKFLDDIGLAASIYPYSAWVARWGERIDRAYRSARDHRVLDHGTLACHPAPVVRL